MKRYSRCPTSGPAKQAWMVFFRRHGMAPYAVWKMPNNFVERDQRSYEDGDRAWGYWVADFGDFKDYWDPSQPEALKARNVLEFIGRQGLASRLLKKIGG